MSTRSRANKRNNKEIEVKENVEIDPQVPQAKKTFSNNDVASSTKVQENLVASTTAVSEVLSELTNENSKKGKKRDKNTPQKTKNDPTDEKTKQSSDLNAKQTQHPEQDIKKTQQLSKAKSNSQLKVDVGTEPYVEPTSSAEIIEPAPLSHETDNAKSKGKKLAAKVKSSSKMLEPSAVLEPLETKKDIQIPETLVAKEEVVAERVDSKPTRKLGGKAKSSSKIEPTVPEPREAKNNINEEKINQELKAPEGAKAPKDVQDPIINMDIKAAKKLGPKAKSKAKFETEQMPSTSATSDSVQNEPTETRQLTRLKSKAKLNSEMEKSVETSNNVKTVDSANKTPKKSAKKAEVQEEAPAPKVEELEPKDSKASKSKRKLNAKAIQNEIESEAIPESLPQLDLPKIESPGALKSKTVKGKNFNTKTVQSEIKSEAITVNHPELELPNIELPGTSKSKAGKGKKATEKAESIPVAIVKQNFKTKAGQEEYVSSQLSIIKGLMTENPEPEQINKLQLVLNDLSEHNNKVSMFLDNKSYTEYNIKKKGLKALDGIDEYRYGLIQSANEKLCPEKQFDFYIFESLLEIASRKGQLTNIAKVVGVYNSNGKVLKKYAKKDLKKKTKTYTNFITSTFSPSYAGKDFHVNNFEVWGGKGEVQAHYSDYDSDELLEEMSYKDFGPYRYDPYNKSDDDDDENVKHKTTTWRSYFLVFWPKSFHEENLAMFEDAPSQKSGARKPSDYETEYAKSARSHCVQCNQKINKDALRMGMNVMNEEWYHMECFFKSQKKLPKVKQIGGFEDLKPEDQKKIQEKLGI